MKFAVFAALFMAALATAQENLPEPKPVAPPKPAAPPATAPAAEPKKDPAAGPKPVPAPDPFAKPNSAPNSTPAPEAKPVVRVSPPAPPPPDVPKPLASRDAADSLTEEELQQVIELLRGNHIRPEALSDTAIARAGVQGLLDRLGTGARVFPKPVTATSQASPFRNETIEGGTAYFRLGALGSSVAGLDKAFDEFGTKPPVSLILDLRATPPDTDFELAAEVCRRFVPRGRVLFSVKRPKANDEEILTSREEPRWRGLLVVLVDHDTAGSAEIIAAVLRTHLRALIIGQKTQGEAAQFDDIALPSGKVLRIAVGEVALPDATPVFPGGLTPDLVVAVTQEKTDEMLRLAESGGVAPLIVDQVRARMTEASLIAGTNPEFDAAQERQRLKAEGKEQKPQVRDETLQRAVDYIKSVAVIEAGRKKRK